MPGEPERGRAGPGRRHIAWRAARRGGPHHGEHRVPDAFGWHQPVERHSRGARAVVDGRADVSRIDGRHTEVGAVLHPEHVRVRGQGPLGDRVRGAERHRHAGQQGGGDDHPAASVQQVRQRGRRNPPRAEQVDLECFPDLRVRRLPDVRYWPYARVVNERVQAAQPLDGLRDRGADLLVVCDVAGQHPWGRYPVDADRVAAQVPQHAERRRAERAGAARDNRRAPGERRTGGKAAEVLARHGPHLPAAFRC